MTIFYTYNISLDIRAKHESFEEAIEFVTTLAKKGYSMTIYSKEDGK